MKNKRKTRAKEVRAHEKTDGYGELGRQADSGACGLPGLRRAFYAGAVSAAVQKKPTKEYMYFIKAKVIFFEQLC